MSGTFAALPCGHGLPVGRCCWCAADAAYMAALKRMLTPRPLSPEGSGE